MLVHCHQSHTTTRSHSLSLSQTQCGHAPCRWTADLLTSSCHLTRRGIPSSVASNTSIRTYHTVKNSLANNPQRSPIHVCVHYLSLLDARDVCNVLLFVNFFTLVASHIIIRDWCCYKWNYFACDPVFIIKWISYAQLCVCVSVAAAANLSRQLAI